MEPLCSASSVIRYQIIRISDLEGKVALPQPVQSNLLSIPVNGRCLAKTTSRSVTYKRYEARANSSPKDSHVLLVTSSQYAIEVDQRSTQSPFYRTLQPGCWRNSSRLPRHDKTLARVQSSGQGGSRLWRSTRARSYSGRGIIGSWRHRYVIEGDFCRPCASEFRSYQACYGIAGTRF